MKKLLLGVWVFALSACGVHEEEDSAVNRSALTVPPHAQITAAQSATRGRLDVRWTDFPDETGYRLFETALTNPPPLMVNGAVSPGWVQISSLARDVTSASPSAFGPRRYVICADDINATTGLITQCVGPSALATPLPALEGAQINGLGVFEVGKTFIGATWRESFSTVRSVVTISPGGEQVENDADEKHRFTNLQPGQQHTLTACAQSQGQLEAGTRTCTSMQISTLPNAPTGIDSLTVVQGTNPRSQTIRFTDDNPASSAASSYLVRLFLDGGNTVLQEQHLTASPGQQTRIVSFSGLQPFSAYEVWVIPYNSSGVGTASGIGFTTPAEVVLSSTPLSGTSAMLQFDAMAYGDYVIERRVGTNVTALTRMRVTQPGPVRVVLEDMNASQVIRVRWELAFLRAQSNEVTVSRGPTGAPEVVHGTFGSQFPFGNVLPLRATARFVPTLNDLGKVAASYVLLADMPGGGTRTLATLSTLPFFRGEEESLSATSTLLVSNPRVCRRVGTAVACSAIVTLDSEGLLRTH